MSELDVLLRASLGRLAEPGDPTGVAEAIRARVEAAGSSGGDSTGSGGSGAGGSGGSGGGSFWTGWAPLGGLALLAAAGGVALGLGLPAAGADGAPGPYTPLTVGRDESVPGAACPGGAAITSLDPGARVLALARDDAGAFLAVRDPGALGSIVWVTAGSAVVDPDADVAGLPVWGCGDTTAIPVAPVPTLAPAPDPGPDPAPAPAPVPAPGPKPAPAPAPQPPADTQKPTLQVGGWSETYVCTVDAGYGPASASISITVGDNVGVTSVTATSPTAGVSLSGPAGSGATRTFTVSRTGNTDATIQVTFTVKDAAGNTVTSNAPGLDSVGPGNCLI